MEDLNLYTRNLRDEHEWYNWWQVKNELKPYVDYLKRVKEHYEESKIILDYKPRDPQPGAGYLIDLGELGDSELHQVYDMDADSVYEFDPGDDARQKFNRARRIRITRRSAKEKTLLLEREPSKRKLVLSRNSYQIQKQIDAVNTLMWQPLPEHVGLLKLFHGDGVEWPTVDEQDVDEWFVLRNEIDGVREQRGFVKKALGTPDFAFLEGPPGSGKTTVLCELVQQLVSRGKRVLFCASTHVAVDNLLERLVDEGAKPMADLIPLRIGQWDNVSEKAKSYQYDKFVQTTKKEIDRHLSSQKPPSKPQRMLRAVLDQDDDTIGQIARDCANLVCGTTIGILQHPDIKNGSLRRFDFMIIDEASKTTLQEFLVTARYADRWIIVGDTKQLSPYTDDDEIAMQVNSCIEKTLGEACLDVFMASRYGHTAVVVTDDEDLKDMYQKQCEKLGVKLRGASAGDVEARFGRGQIVIGSPASVSRLSPPNGQDITIRNCDQLLCELERQKDGRMSKQWAHACKRQRPENHTWGEQVGWRIRSRFPDAVQHDGRQKIEEAINDLMPSEGAGEMESRLNEVKAVALPSVLESLEEGTGVVDGIPAHSFGDRHVLLAWQYRMHPDIASFSHKHVYEERALRTPDAVESKRSWSYGRYRSRSVWIDVRGGAIRNSKSHSNEREAMQIVKEIKKFYEYACGNPKPDGRPWAIAILSFYSGQVATLREHVRRLTGQSGSRYFKMPQNEPVVEIELHTVDRFQGHEADLVFLSLVRQRPTIFLNHLNRINVAITRARYQCVIVGNRESMSKSDPPLRDLADETPAQHRIPEGRR